MNLERGRDGRYVPKPCLDFGRPEHVGIVRVKLNQNLSRNMATEWPAWRSCPWVIVRIFVTIRRFGCSLVASCITGPF